MQHSGAIFAARADGQWRFERRGSPRRYIAIPSSLYQDGGLLCACTVQDISVGGARVMLSRDVPLPEQVRFLDHTTCRAWQSRVLRRSGLDVALAFDRRDPTTPPARRWRLFG